MTDAANFIKPKCFIYNIVSKRSTFYYILSSGYLLRLITFILYIASWQLVRPIYKYLSLCDTLGTLITKELDIMKCCRCVATYVCLTHQQTDISRYLKVLIYMSWSFIITAHKTLYYQLQIRIRGSYFIISAIIAKIVLYT